MASIVGTVITALAVSVVLFPILIKYNWKEKILSRPDHRRIHERITPSMGGVAIFFGFLTATVVWLNVTDSHSLQVIITILFATFLLGVCDDLIQIKPKTKILGQAIAGSLLFFLLDIRLTSAYGLLGDHDFSYTVSYLVTVFVVIIITNSFNLIDGIDGLAGTFSALCLIFFGTWFYLVKDVDFSLLSFALTGAVLAFLIFNWEPSKIFMGDTGALFIGMMLSILTIRFMNTNAALPPGDSFKFNATIATAIAVIIIPAIDTARIIIIRLSKGVSPLMADKRHIHHDLVRLGFNHSRAVLLLSGIHLLYLLAALSLSEYGDRYLLLGIIVTSVIFCLVLSFFSARKPA